MNLLDQLRKMTVVVADSGDFETIAQYQPRDTTTNPSLLFKAAQMPHYRPLLDDAISSAQSQGGDPAKQMEIVEKLQKYWADNPTYVNVGQWYLPLARRNNVEGNLTAPAPVFWNVTKK